MAFPEIIIGEPIGTQMVSEIDDEERKTRSWLKQCMKEISGYPSVNTVAVKMWDNDYVSENNLSCPEGKVLLGYNSETKSLQVISSNGADAGLSKAIALLAHPVGSYYETSDANFNPNTEWGGVWELDTPGRVLVAQGRKQDANGDTIIGSHLFEADEIGGEEVHCLARPEIPAQTGDVSELPIHYHPHRHPHTHEVSGFLQKIEEGDNTSPEGYLATSGTVAVKIGTIKSGLPTKEDYAYSMGEANNTEIGWFALQNPSYTLHGMVDADTLSPDEASAQNPRTISEDLIMHVGSKIGENGHNNLQPYKVCYRWHRLPDPVEEEEEEENNG